MNGMMALVIIGIAAGCATFLVAALRARCYAIGNTIEAPRRREHTLRGMAWLALAALGALFVYTSIEFQARMNERQAELIRRKTIVASQDVKVRLYRDGLLKLQDTVAEAKGNPASQDLAKRIEAIVAEIRKRERALP